MDIGDNLKVVTLVGFHCSAEQLLNIPLELFYAELGADGAFKVWWLYHLVMFLQCYLALPAALIWNAHDKFTELSGLTNPIKRYLKRLCLVSLLSILKRII